MNDKSRQDDPIRTFMIWGPRILIGISIVLLVYFTQRTYRFSGLFDDTFLAEDNLNLVRGPFAPKEYYERGLLDYKASSLFPEEEASSVEDVTVSPEVSASEQVSVLEIASGTEEATAEE